MTRDELAYVQQENLKGRKKFVWISIPNSYSLRTGLLGATEQIADTKNNG
jgi:hypothetical protein